MVTPVLTFLDLIYPFILGGAVLVLMRFIKKGENDVFKIQIPVFGIFNFEGALRKLWMIRTFLFLLALVFFSISAFRDYARFFPVHMQMEVFFDDDGVEKALAQFDEDELREFNIPQNWRDEKVTYVDSLNKVLESIHNPFRFDPTKGVVRSKGENQFKVEKVEVWGWQKYHIESGKGSVTHVYEVPGQAPQTITSTFELLETDSNNIQLSFAEIYYYWKKVIKPEYKQKFNKTPADVFYSHNLVALTKVRFFPFIDINKTVYPKRLEPTNKYIPIGFSIYYPD